jgi:hypothetical protein
MRLSILILVLLLFGCQKTIKTPDEFFVWLNNPNNGLLKTKVVDGLEFTLKYLPPEYLALKELRGKYSTKEAQVLKERYEKNFSFLLTIKPVDKEEKNIMLRGVSDETEYLERLNNLQFRTKDYLRLKVASKEIPPILSTFENMHGATKHHNIYMVFGGENAKELKTIKDWDIVFDDELFGTGIHHFQYESRLLLNLPILNFWTKNNN